MFVIMDLELYHGFYSTPPLWIHSQFGIPQFVFPELDISKIDAVPVPDRLRLGHQMEFVFAHLINASRSWGLIAKNLLVDAGKTRIGELDFLLQHTKTEAVFHIELAYKFYIINPEISEPVHRLMGPNKRDMFFTKLDKLKEKQFPLLYHEGIANKLSTLNINPTKVRQQACFKAQLFIPFNASKPNIRPLNIACIAGSWIRFDAFDDSPFQDFEYYIPYKQEWVLQPVLERPYMNHFETLLEVNMRMIKENAPLLWVKKPLGVIEKLFVVWWQ